ncbi:MAG TPA: Clp protease N-terminal domain-containing protein, partial [Chloroflexota bacterium]|nr:Clp protease N-terminal domain-containing protein [Chloroflexota bacterium]
SIGGLRVLDFAEDEARRLGEVRIGTEHVLLGVLKFGYRNAHILSLLAGLLEDDDGPIAEIVRSSGADVRAARQGVAATLTSTAERWAGEANPFNPRELRLAMRVGLALRWAVWEARRRRQTTVDAPHLLLGFVHESEQTDGCARERATVPARVEAGGATVLERAGLDAGAVRAALEARLGPVTRTLP